MNHLLRELAPIGESAWAAIETEAAQRLGPMLAARRLVDFSGPHGWEWSCTNLGRAATVAEPEKGVRAQVRRVLPAVELRTSFEIARAELQDAERGARDADLAGLDAAAARMARAENRAVFHGSPAAGLSGIAAVASHDPVAAPKSYSDYPRPVAQAVELLKAAGVGGPYGLALGPDPWTRVVETAEHGGYPLFEHLQHIVGGPIVWAPGVEGGIVLSLRGGDFVLELGQDTAIGYLGHTAQSVQLYLEESLTFRVDEPDAAVVIRTS